MTSRHDPDAGQHGAGAVAPDSSYYAGAWGGRGPRPYEDLDEAVRIANHTDFGLAGFVLGGSLQRCLDVADRLEVGMVGINDFAIALAEAPFGGIKHSGFGREGGAEGVAEFTVVKYINVAPA